MPPDAFQKRIKRNLIGREQHFMVATPPGFEEVCHNEIRSLAPSLHTTPLVPGGVSVTGRLVDCYRMNLHLRTANRILMRIAQFKATNFRVLVKRLAAIPWELYLNREPAPRIRVTTRHSRLYHTDAVRTHVGQTIAAKQAAMVLGDTTRHRGLASQLIFVRIVNDTVQISIDSSGDLLHKRGLKSNVGRAPIRETLAAGALSLAGFNGMEVLLDPMCGSGTFTLEAAMLARNIPSGGFRDFAFMTWPSFRSRQWNHIRRSALAAQKPSMRPQVFASDENAAATAGLQRTIERLGWQSTVHVDTGNFFNLKPETIASAPGTMVLNPPYGQRLGTGQESRRRFKAICRKLGRDFKGWRTILIAPNRTLARQTGLHLTPHVIRHGGKVRTLLTGVI